MIGKSPFTLYMRQKSKKEAIGKEESRIYFVFHGDGANVTVFHNPYMKSGQGVRQGVLC